MLAVGVVGCQAESLPEYWLCQGHSQQRVYSTDGQLLEHYLGADPLLLERYGDSVFEFSAPVMFGLFTVCTNDSGVLLLRDKDCARTSEQPNYREAHLNLQSGALRYADKRQLPEKIVTTVADYQCQYLGHAYTFKDLEQDESH